MSEPHPLKQILDRIAAADDTARKRWAEWKDVSAGFKASLEGVIRGLSNDRPALLRMSVEEELLFKDLPLFRVTFQAGGLSLRTVGHSEYSVSVIPACLVFAPQVSGRIAVGRIEEAIQIHDKPADVVHSIGFYEPGELPNGDVLMRILRTFLEGVEQDRWSTDHRPDRARLGFHSGGAG